MFCGETGSTHSIGQFPPLEPHSMLRKGPTSTRLCRKLPLAAPDRVSETQVRLTDHELQIGGEGILASVRQGPPTQYRLWIRHIPRACAARGRRCLDKERPESDRDNTHTIGKRTCTSTSIEYSVEPANHAFARCRLNAWGRGPTVPASLIGKNPAGDRIADRQVLPWQRAW